MIYEDRVVIFLDILGFREKVYKSTDSEKTLNDIINAFQEIDKFVKNLSSDDVQITIFSDSIIISFKKNVKAQVVMSIIHMNRLCHDLIKHNILIRGGMTSGKMIHKNNNAFGPAMIEAYDLESKAAIYPRIIFSNEILNIAYDAQLHSESEIMRLGENLFESTDGWYYLDYISPKHMGTRAYEYPTEYLTYLTQISNIILNNSNSNSISITQKYLWLTQRVRDAIVDLTNNLTEIPDRKSVKKSLKELKSNLKI